MVPMVIAYKALMNCSVELISISVGRLFHSSMVLAKKLCWYAVMDGDYWCYKVIQMVLSQLDIMLLLCSMVTMVHLYAWLGYNGILFYAIN